MFDVLTALGSVAAIYVIIIFCYLIFTLTTPYTEIVIQTISSDCKH